MYCIKATRVPVRWCDLEKKFGYLTSALSELFWEYISMFKDNFEYLLSTQTDFLRRQAEVYSKEIIEMESHLPNCVGFWILPR